MDYMTAKEASIKWNISQRRVQILCSQNRIKGIFKLGDAWAIPSDAEKPKDERVKSGRYVKNVYEDKEEINWKQKK